MKPWSLSQKPQCLMLYAWVPLSVAGCAWMPPGGERADFLEPPAMEKTLSDAGQRVSDKAPAWPEDQWWRQFRAPTLDSIMDAALKDNESLRKAYDRLRAADAVAKVEGARLLPWLDSNAGMKQSRYAEHGVVASYNHDLAGAEKTLSFINPVAIRYEFDFWGKNRAALEAALGDAAAQDAEYADVRLVMTTAVARAYIRGASLAQQLRLAQEMVALRHELVGQAESRFRTGVGDADAVKLATDDLELAIQREARTRDILTLHQDLLASFIAQGPDVTRDIFVGKAVPARFSAPSRLPIELLAHRPDLAAAMHRAEAAAQRIHMAKTEFLPSIDLTAVGGLEASVFTKNASNLLGLLFSGGALNYAIAPGIHLPLFEGGRLRGQLEARRAEYDEAVDLYNQTLLDAVRQVADSSGNVKQTRTILEAQYRLVSSKRAELSLAAVRMRNGLTDEREILGLRHAILEQQFVSKTLEADHLFALVDLIQALGGGYSTGVEQARPRIAAEDSMAGLENLTPAAVLESLAPALLPEIPNATAERR